MLGCWYRQMWAQGSRNTALRSSFHEQNSWQEENCAVLGYHAASSGNSLTDVSGQPIGPVFKGQESKKKKKTMQSRRQFYEFVGVVLWTNEVGGACGTCGEKSIHGSGGET